MLQYQVGNRYLACGSILCIWLQEVTDEVLGIITDVLPVPLVEDYSGVAALVDKVLEILATERRVTAEQGICDHTERPHIYWLSVTLLHHYFWCSVAK